MPLERREKQATSTVAHPSVYIGTRVSAMLDTLVQTLNYPSRASLVQALIEQEFEAQRDGGTVQRSPAA